MLGFVAALFVILSATSDALPLAVGATEDLEGRCLVSYSSAERYVLTTCVGAKAGPDDPEGSFWLLPIWVGIDPSLEMSDPRAARFLTRYNEVQRAWLSLEKRQDRDFEAALRKASWEVAERVGRFASMRAGRQAVVSAFCRHGLYPRLEDESRRLGFEPLDGDPPPAVQAADDESLSAVPFVMLPERERDTSLCRATFHYCASALAASDHGDGCYSAHVRLLETDESYRRAYEASQTELEARIRALHALFADRDKAYWGEVERLVKDWQRRLHELGILERLAAASREAETTPPTVEKRP